MTFADMSSRDSSHVRTLSLKINHFNQLSYHHIIKTVITAIEHSENQTRQ
jgi:hypothetical protein